MSQQELAEFLHVDQASISFWENGKIIPSGPAMLLIQVLLSMDAHPSNIEMVKRENI